MYESPIEMIYGELQTQMMQESEKLIMKAVRIKGVNVDKEALIKALQYDRNQYSKGYEDGKNDVLDKIRAEIDKIYEREGSSFDCLNALDELKEFIDKYKGEMRDKE